MSWARLDALAGRASDRLFGERVKIVPIRNAGPVVVGGADPDRLAFIIRATLDVTEHSEHLRGEGSRSGSRQDLMVQECSLLIEAGTILDLTILPKVGDRIVALERPGFPEFKVATPAKQNGGRFLFMLVPV